MAVCVHGGRTHNVGFLSSRLAGTDGISLETVYSRKPIVVNTCAIVQMDIQPNGFRVIPTDGDVTDDTVRQAKRVLDDGPLRREMVERNYEITRQRCVCQVLRRKRSDLIEDSIACWL